VRFEPFYINDEPDAARVVFELRVVKTLLGWRTEPHGLIQIAFDFAAIHR
jgi:hypothetical protein